jgi:hypothetical protein
VKEEEGMKLHRLLGFWVSVLLSLTIISGASGQQPSSVPHKNQAGKRDSRRKKVWTNDDVVRIRTSSDIYLGQKLVAEEKAAEANKAASKAADNHTTNQRKSGGIEIVMPKTVAEAEKRIAEKNQDVSHLQPLLQDATDEYFRAPDAAARQIVQKKIDLVTGQLNRAGTEVKLLEIELEELKSNPQQPVSN